MKFITIENIALALSFMGVIFNCLLWITNNSTLKEIKKQNENFISSLQGETTFKIISSHQNIFLKMLEESEDLSIFDEDSHSENKKKIIGTLLLNHYSAIFNYSKNNFLDEDEWIGLQNDILYSFRDLPFIKKRWQQIKIYYSEEFQEFINNLVEKGRLDYR